MIEKCAARRHLHPPLPSSSQAEDAARGVEGELASRAARVLQLEAVLKARERDADKAARAADAAKSVQADAELQVRMRARHPHRPCHAMPCRAILGHLTLN